MATQTRTQNTPAAGAALGFTSQEEEVSGRQLALAGELPDWLGGTLVRVTPALLDPGGRAVRHWFDGLAMLNAFTIADGGRVLRQPVPPEPRVRNVREHGEIRGRTFGSDPCRTIFQRVSSLFNPAMTDNMQRERDTARRALDRHDGDAAGHRVRPGDPRHHRHRCSGRASRARATAHPQYDFDRREAVSYSVRFGRSQQLPPARDPRRPPRAARGGQRARARAGVHALLRAH